MGSDNQIGTRRKSDKFVEDTDHDLIVAHSVKIDNLCKLVKGLGVKFDNYSDKMDIRCETRLDSFTTRIDHTTEESVDENTFKWIIGIMIFAMISMVAMIGVNQVAINSNRQYISVNNDHLNELKKDFEKAENRTEKYHMKDLLNN